MEEKEFPSSDDSDSDFEVNLEEELSGDSEQSDGDGSESEAGEEEKSSSKKKTKKGKTRKKRTKKAAKKTRSSNVEETDSNSKQSTDTDSKLTAEQEKERADSLWKSFLSDASIPSKSQPNTPKTTANSSPSKKGSNSVETKKEESLKQEEEIGEIKFKKVEETKTKALDIREIVKPSLKSPLTSTNENGNKCKVTSPLLTQENSSKKRGISSLLGNMQKKTKLSTLEKSKLDWNQFKEEQNLQEEITTFNRGKNGYLEKQDFLQRTDTRQFELEKELRNVGRRKAR